jgi:hypothetical protein
MPRAFPGRSTWSATPTRASRAPARTATSCATTRTSSSRAWPSPPTRWASTWATTTSTARSSRSTSASSRAGRGPRRRLPGRRILGSDFSFQLHAHHGFGAYICGEETALLESLEGKKGQPRFKPPFPASFGLYGKPTTINNTETFAAVPWIIRNGGQAYLECGKPNNGGTKIFSVVGRRQAPGQLRDPAGHAVSKLLELAGGVKGGALKAVIPGGSSAPVLPADIMMDLHDGLRLHRQGRLDAGLGRGHRDGRHPLHGQEPAAPVLLLPARELRPVHALPRRHGLAVARGRPHRTRQGPRKTSPCWTRWPTTSRAARSARWATRRRCRCAACSSTSATSSCTTSNTRPAWSRQPADRGGRTNHG